MLLPCFRRGRVWAAPRLHYESSFRLLGIMSNRSRRLHDCTLRIIHAPNEVFPFPGHPLHPIFANALVLRQMPLGSSRSHLSALISGYLQTATFHKLTSPRSDDIRCFTIASSLHDFQMSAGHDFSQTTHISLACH